MTNEQRQKRDEILREGREGRLSRVRKTPEQKRESLKAWRKANPEKMREYGRTTLANRKERGEKRVRDKEGARRWHRKHLYGITDEQYQSLLKEQDNACAICECVPRDGTVLSVDHDHTTGRVRGLLCRPCNFTVGLCETRGYVEKAQEYIEKHKDPELKMVI